MTEAQADIAGHGGPAEQQQVAAAAQLYGPLKRSAGFAALSGGTMLFFGLITLLSLAFGFDPVSLVLGAALCVCGSIERGAAARIRAGDPAAFTRLGWNQWAVFVVIAGYALVQLYVIGGAAAYAELSAVDPNMGALAAQMSDTMYTAVILLSFLFQGLMARMYFRRRALAERYRDEVPEWIRRVVQGLAV